MNPTFQIYAYSTCMRQGAISGVLYSAVHTWIGVRYSRTLTGPVSELYVKGALREHDGHGI